MIIHLNDKWRIVVDKYGNYSPEIYREKSQDKGKFIPTGVFDWMSTYRYFPNIEQSLRWIIQQELLDCGDYESLEQYLTKCYEYADYYVGLLNAETNN